VQIRDKLAESGERTLFGGLSGQAGIWDKIVKAYDNGGGLSAHLQIMRFRAAAAAVMDVVCRGSSGIGISWSIIHRGFAVDFIAVAATI
jgi:hypothetical protein